MVFCSLCQHRWGTILSLTQAPGDGRALQIALYQEGVALFGRGPLAVSPGVGWAVHSPGASGISSCSGVSATLRLAPLGASAPAPSHGLAQASCCRMCQEGCSLHSYRSSCWDMFLHAGGCCILLWTHGVTGDEQENEVFFSAVG